MADDQQQVRDVLDKSVSLRERSERAHELTTMAFEGMKATRRRQRTTRDFLRGRISAGLPKAIRDAAVRHGGGSLMGVDETLEYHAPHVALRTLQEVARYQAKAPTIKRHPVARARESGAVSTRIERVAVGVMGEKWPYRQSCDPVAIDSEACSWVIPATAHWFQTDQYDYLSEDDWRQLPDDLKALWGREDDGGQRYRRYKRQYRRDRDGKAEWDDDYRGREDTEASAEAFREEMEQRARAKIPLQIDLLLPQQFAPINPHWEGDALRVDGIARREVFGGTDLYKRGYRWGNDISALAANPAYNSVAPVTLDSLLLQDGDGRPYLIYAVDGARTYRRDENDDYHECLDLYEQYGLDFLPVTYAIGFHTMSADFDDVIVPSLEPLIVPSLMRDRLVAMNDYHVQNTSCGGWFVKIDPQIQAVMPELAAKPEFRVVQMAATPVPGDIVPSVHPGAGPGLVVQKEMLDQDLMAAGPVDQQQASSGIHDALIGRDADRNNSMTWSAIDALYAGTATNALRVLACMARTVADRFGGTITLTLLTSIPDDTSSSTQSTAVVDPDMFGGDYRVVTWRPDDWGSDPTRQMMLMDAHDRKKATWTEFRESIGDPDPMGSFAEIVVEDYLMSTPEGKAEWLERAAKKNADLRQLKQAQLRRDKLLNEQNVPMAAAAGVADPLASEPLNAGGNPSVTLDATQAAGINPAQQALNATAGAPTAALSQIANAGGDISGVEFGGGV